MHELRKYPLPALVVLPTLATLATFVSFVSLAACQKATPTAPATKPAQAQVAAPAATAAPAAPAPSVQHTIGEGETLWDIAHSYGVTMKDLMAANGLKPNDVHNLRKGSQIKIPGVNALVDVQTRSDRAAEREALPPLKDGAYHFVQRGESLWTLARLYDVSIDEINARNGFGDDAAAQLRLGQAVIIPGIKASQVKEPQQTKATKRDGLMHEVARGETVSEIAHRFQVGVSEIMAANGMTRDEAANIRDGQRLFLPGVVDDGSGHVQRKRSRRELAAERTAGQLGLGTLQAAGLLLHGQLEPRWIKAASQASGMKANELEGWLRWPVSWGTFVRGFGSGQGGYHKAMDIKGNLGWNVHAAADGIVGYSGNKVSGFGNMIMVVHPGGWVTLYAHHSVNYAVAGQKVKRGDVLAEVGSTGRSQGPHVHFELIFQGKNCDPAPLFRGGVRYRKGKVIRGASVRWTNPLKKPSVILCAKRQKHPLGLSIEAEDADRDAQHVSESDVVDEPAEAANPSSDP